MRIIGLTGPAGCGKSTVARILVMEHGFVEFSFAAPIREFVAGLLGLSLNELEQRKEANTVYGQSARYMMQTLGTEWARDLIHEDFWVLRVKDAIRRLSPSSRSVVISDVRFENEAEFIRNAVWRGGSSRLWHLLRPGKIMTAHHSSERGVSIHDDDAVLANDCNSEELNKRVAQLLGESPDA